MRCGFEFRALQTLAKDYGRGGVNAIRKSLGLTGYKSGMPRLSSSAVKALKQADKDLPGDT